MLYIKKDYNKNDVLNEIMINNIVNGKVGVEIEFGLLELKHYSLISARDVFSRIYKDDEKKLSRLLDDPIGTDGDMSTFEIRTPPLYENEIGDAANNLITQTMDMIDNYCDETVTNYSIDYTRKPYGIHLTFDFITFNDYLKKIPIVFDRRKMKNLFHNTIYVYGKLGNKLSPPARYRYSYCTNTKIKGFTYSAPEKVTLFSDFSMPLASLPLICIDNLSVDELYYNYKRYFRTDEIKFFIYDSKYDVFFTVFDYIKVKNIVIELRQMPSLPSTIVRLNKIIAIAKYVLLCDLFRVNISKHVKPILDEIKPDFEGNDSVEIIDRFYNRLVDVISNHKIAKRILNIYSPNTI